MLIGKLMAAATATAILGALTVGVGAGGAATNPTVSLSKVSCNSTTFPSPVGLWFGTLKCSKPLGAGVSRLTFHESVTGDRFSWTGSYKNYFDRGTIHGTYKMTGTIAGGVESPGTGVVTVTGGTGAFRGATGKGVITCTTHDGGKTFPCSSGPAPR
jgi:hypothetical protein